MNPFIPKLTYIIPFAAGLVLVVVSWFSVEKSIVMRDDWVPGKALVTSQYSETYHPGALSDSTGPVTEYIKARLRAPGEREIALTLEAGHRDHPVGEEITVLYPPDDPAAAILPESTWTLPLQSIIGAIACFGVGISILIRRARKDERQAALITHGQQVAATVTGIMQDESITVNGRHPYRIHAEWHDRYSTNRYSFTSEWIWFNPETTMADMKTITVYLDPKNPDKYVVDLSFLPSRHEAHSPAASRRGTS